MRIDIRLPMGLMFSIIGAIMFVYGLITMHSGIYLQKSLGIDVNLWWGLTLLIFGFIMLLLTYRAYKRRGSLDESIEHPAEVVDPYAQDQSETQPTATTAD